MLPSLFRILGVLGIIYVLVCALAWRYQDRLAFPSPRMRLPQPSEARIAGDLVSVPAADGVILKGWYLPPKASTGRKAPGVLWFYGNMESVAGLAPILDYLHDPETGLLALDYRGYGENEGSLTEPLLYRDAESAWSYLASRPEIDPARIAVYGRSLGSVSALYIGTTKPVLGVILDSPLTTAREMARIHYAFVPSFLLRFKLDNLDRAAGLSAPLLVFHGTRDEIAPISMGERIAEAGSGELVRLEGAGHNDTYDVGGKEYRDKLWAFLDKNFVEERRGTRKQ